MVKYVVNLFLDWARQCYVNGLHEIMYSIPEDATTGTNKDARMVDNPTGAMVFHQPPASLWDNTSILNELVYNPEKFVSF